MFKLKGPVPFIILMVVIIIVGIIVMVATGGEGFSAHWEFTF